MYSAFMNATQEENAYLAGLIDGEGTITLHWRAPHGAGLSRMLSISNTYMPVLTWVQERYGGKIRRQSYAANENQHDGYCWNVYRRPDMERILRAVLPFLVIKKRHAELVLEMGTLIVTRGRPKGGFLPFVLVKKRRTLLAELGRLNHRGRTSYKATPYTPQKGPNSKEALRKHFDHGEAWKRARLKQADK